MTQAKDKTKAGCPCDALIHPMEVKIAAGLEDIPRQIADFTEFRRAMLTTLRQQTALTGWRAQHPVDLGVMLLEMWAYVCDTLAFYDKVIAQECYMRTSKGRASLRKLVGLLGYEPRPAVAASVKLAVLAEGRKPVTLPRGTAFRSGAFDGEAPQVFELEAATTVHPFNNRFTLEHPRPNTWGSSSSTQSVKTDSLLLKPETARLKAGDLVLVEGATSDPQVRKVKRVTTYPGTDGKKYVQIMFSEKLKLSAGVMSDQVTLSTPTQTAHPWTLSISTGTKNNEIALDGLYRQINLGDRIILSTTDKYGCCTVQGMREIIQALPEAAPSEVKDISGNKTYTIKPAPVQVPVTALSLNPQDGNAASILADYNNANATPVVHYGLMEAGTVTLEAKSSIAASDSLKVAGAIDVPVDHKMPSTFLLEDKNEAGFEVTGALDSKTGQLSVKPGTSWSAPLAAPVEIYGNVVRAGRGETVTGEILGSGDASIANQTFKLKKKPLTYLHSPTADNERGVVSTLKLYVDGVLWKEIPSFFKAGAQDQVYILRQDDEGQSLVTFGDGRHGARLPTGVNNAVACYRHGAGGATPPSGSITQLGKPVKGIQGIRNPLAAFGGGDADSAEDIRAYAPRSALILGRAVSLQDFEAVAAAYPGVKAVRVEWRWHGERQRPVAQIWYVGKSDLEETLAGTLQTLSDPALAVDVETAQPVALQLSMSIDIDERYDQKTVLETVCRALTDPKRGLLAPANIGIGRPLYRSRVYERVLTVGGCLTVTGIQHNGSPFTALAIDPGAGSYFDLEMKGGALLLNGQEYPHG